MFQRRPYKRTTGGTPIAIVCLKGGKTTPDKYSRRRGGSDQV